MGRRFKRAHCILGVLNGLREPNPPGNGHLETHRTMSGDVGHQGWHPSEGAIIFGELEFGLVENTGQFHDLALLSMTI
jgi:hypothetical protein